MLHSGSKTNRSGDESKYGMEFELSNAIDTSASNWALRPRSVQMVLKKKDAGDFWSHLPAEHKQWKPHVCIDWDKWVDEDEEEEAPANRFGDMADLMGGGAGGMGGMGGMDINALMEGMKNSGAGGADIGADDEDDSDDDGKIHVPIYSCMGTFLINCVCVCV